MSEPVTWAAVGIAAVANMGSWLLIWRGRNGMRRNSNTARPGESKICRERGEKMAVLETRQNGFEADLVEIKGDLRAIREAVVRK
jgi:hypothetical protein